MNPSNSKPWGWKVTLHLYGTGDPPHDDLVTEAADLAEERLGADDFVGADTQIIQTQPTDQVAS